MGANQEDVEIDLINLFLHVIRKWKVILAIGLILAISTFSFKYYKEVSSFKDAGVQKVAELEEKIASLNSSQKSHEDYLENSILVKSPFKLYESKYRLSVKVNAAQDNSKIQQVNLPISEFCKNILFNAENQLLFRKDLKVETENNQVFEDLFEFDNESDSYVDVTVYADTKENLAKLEDHIDLLRSELSNKLGDKFDITLLKISSKYGDNDLGNTKKFRELGLVNRIKADLKTYEKELKDNQPQDYVKISTKFGLFGLIGGLFLGFTIYSFIYVFEGRLRDKNYLQNAFAIRTIACLKTAFYKHTDKKELEKLIGSLKILCKEQKKVVAVSTLTKEQLTESLTAINQVMQELDVDFELVDPCKVQAVNDADKVFILEKIDESKLEAVVDEVNLIKTFSQNLLGVIYA